MQNNLPLARHSWNMTAPTPPVSSTLPHAIMHSSLIPVDPTWIDIRLLADGGLFIFVWLQQLIIYPALHLIEGDAFVNWHRKNTIVIAILAAPFMLIQLVIALLLTYRDPGLIHWLSIILISLTWVSTYIFTIPCHIRLKKGKDHATIGRLVVTNWPRTIAWTLILALSIISN